MFKFNRLLVLVMFVLFSSSVALAVEEFRVSKYGKGEQIWFEAEAFDERSPNENYKLGKAEKAVKLHKDAFGGHCHQCRWKRLVTL